MRRYPEGTRQSTSEPELGAARAQQHSYPNERRFFEGKNGIRLGQGFEVEVLKECLESEWT